MNTAGRRKRSTVEDLDENLIRSLIDESKFYRVEDAQNKWDQTMKMAAFLTKRYMQKYTTTIDSTFCKQSITCSLFL